MNYELLREVLSLVEEFDLHADGNLYTNDVHGFKNWICSSQQESTTYVREAYWEGKENGRSAESAISTLLVHLNRYAKTYSKSAIHASEFSTQEDFIYLISLKAFGSMTKMELIKKNLQDKPTGIQIINRLHKNGWIVQSDSQQDKRSKIIAITSKGLEVLNRQMDKIRQATNIVAGDLSYGEKMDLIHLLSKLYDFHHPIFLQNIDSGALLDQVQTYYLPSQSRVP